MPVRSFAGGGVIKTAVGLADPAGPFTLAALVKRGGSAEETLWCRVAVGGGGKGGWSAPILQDAGSGMRFTPGGKSAYVAPGGGHWLLIVMVRPASGQKCKYYVYDYTAAFWVAKEDAEVSNIEHTAAAGETFIGQYGETEKFVGTYAAAAVFGRAFTQPEAEQLKGLGWIARWLTMTPLALWMFNQGKVEELVKDRTGNGANQIARTGTAVVAEEPPIPYTQGAVPPQNVMPPVVGGLAEVGEQLTVTPGEWENETESFIYQWQEAEEEEGPWTVIPSLGNPTLLLTAAQEGKFVRCVVTATNTYGSTAQESAAVGPVEVIAFAQIGEEQGFPDWQPQLARPPAALYDTAGVVLTEETVLGPFYVGKAEAVNLLIQQVAGNKAFRVFAYWHVNPARTQPYVVQSFYLHPESGELHQQLQVEAAHLSLVFVPLAAGGEATHRALIQVAPGPVSERRLGEPLLLDAAAVKVAKESSTTRLLSRTAPGRALLLAAASGEGAGRTVTLEQLNEKAEWVRFAGFALPNTGTPIAVSVALPSSPVRFTLGNTTAGEVSFDLAVGIG